ncbi:MAG: 3-methyl-2-oxobutanoate hydroxymethyltransferase [Rickettsiales bacterium]|nr:3-methyl-2-oxobutanoate hydroxymethyltransferase [Rickettsiales bacterium]|tara:strand:- start:738 stop:1562 length:825 start_codon:yes stop_codon:yes gene_type:complete
MSKHNAPARRLSVRDIKARKGKVPIVSLTAYGAPFAALFDPHIDLFIVGDSLGMVLYGRESTLDVSLNTMIAHATAVVNTTKHALVVVDMPFGAYQESKEQAFRHAAKLLQRSGAHAVKMEAGMELVETVAFLTERGIPVMAHTGLKPQHLLTAGGYRYQGRTESEAEGLLAEAHAFEDAGAFALLLEGTSEPVAKRITEAVHIPTIGIGASPACDGQVLVSEDMLGLHETTPRFVREFANLRNAVSEAAAAYATAVRERQFPGPAECYTPKAD